MSPILFFIIFFICTGVGKIFLQINSAAVAFIDILIAAWEGLDFPIRNKFLSMYVKSLFLHTFKCSSIMYFEKNETKYLMVVWNEVEKYIQRII